MVEGNDCFCSPDRNEKGRNHKSPLAGCRFAKKIVYIQSNPTFKTKQGKKRVIPMNEVVYHLLSMKAGRAISEYVFHIKGRKIYDDHASKKLKEYVDE